VTLWIGRIDTASNRICIDVNNYAEPINNQITESALSAAIIPGKNNQ